MSDREELRDKLRAAVADRQGKDAAPLEAQISHEPPQSDAPLVGIYTGQKGPLFKLALQTAVLTALTLGIYRFWERTRIRRYIWSATSPGGDAFEYTGTAKEKLLGFLIAVVVLGAVLGTLQVGLMFLGLSLFSEAQTDAEELLQVSVFQMSFLVLLPFWGFAQYRGYRYRMSRTRWRGIRFGVEAGAWGYVWRYTGLMLLTFLTLGVLWPLMAFKLEKYRTDRTWYGNAQLHQEGHWQMLYPTMKQILFALIAYAVAGAALFWEPFLGICGLVIATFWFCAGVAHCRVRSFAILTEQKRLGDDIRFGCDPEPTRVSTHVIGGGLFTLVLGFLTVLPFAVVLQLSGVIVIAGGQIDLLTSPGVGEQVFSILGTLLILQIYGVFAMIFVIQPIYAHIVSQTWVKNPIRLTSIKQRTQDDLADADGFADALDVGGAF